MDRKSQIFKQTKTIGGVRRPVVPKQPLPVNLLKKTLEQFKGSVVPTMLTTCSFKSGEEIHTIVSPKIQSITKGKKNICFVVSGEETIDKQDDILKKIPKGVEKDLEKLKMSTGLKSENETNKNINGETENNFARNSKEDELD